MAKLLSFLGCGFLACSIPLFAQTAGKIISLQGRADVLKAGANIWTPAVNLQILGQGDKIRTSNQSRVVLLLADETQLKLNANTALELRNIRQSSSLIARVVQTSTTQSDQSLLNLAAGQIWLRSKLKPANVRISTPAVTAAIRGTEFDLKVADSGESIITMLEGSVDFRNDQGALLVSSGEQARARIGQAPTKSVLLRPRDAVQWVLYYPGAISASDYPFLSQPPDQLKGTLAQAAARRANVPDDIDNLLLLARAQHDSGQKNDAEGTYEALLKFSPRNLDAQVERAWIYLETNRVSEAIRLLNQIEEKSDRAIVGLALAHYRQGDVQAFFETIRKADPARSSLAATQRAFSELLYGNAQEASRLLEGIAQSDAYYSLAQGLLSNIQLAQNDKEKALASCRRAVSSNPRSPSAYLNLSLIQQSFFEIPQALESAQRALELDPEFVTAQAQVAKMLFSMGNTAQAERIARQGLQKNPSEAALNSLLGFVLLAQAKTQEARTYFEKSIAQDGTRGEPHLGLGIASMRGGEREAAIQSILVGATLEPEVAIYQSYLGKAFYDLRRFEMAFDALDNATKLDARDPTPHLYSGIFFNDLSRPAKAVRSFNKSIELNNNRAVYRSRFLLDEDRATRNVNLAGAYNRLYLSEWGNSEAIKSQMADPTSSSVHTFMAQTFLNLRGRIQAAGSEQLLARTLLPVNSNSFNAFNDYTTLFEEPHAYWTIQGSVGSFNARTATLIASGGTNRFAYGLNGTYFTTNGFRPRNDDRLSFDGIAQFKFALTPHSDLLAFYSHGQQNSGDLAPGTIGPDNNPYRRQSTRRHRFELSYHKQFRPGSDAIVYFSGQQFETVADDDHYFPNLFGAGLRGGLRAARRDPDLNMQATHLYKVGPFQLRYGVDLFEGRSRDRRTIPCCLPAFDSNFGESVELRKIRYKNAFLYSDYIVTPRLILTGAVHYDWANDNNFDKAPEEPRKPISKWNPQAGVLFSPLDSTTFRFAFIRSLQTHFRERLAPSNILGFVIAQNDPRLAENTSYNFGWDQHLFASSFFRASGYYRDRDTPVLVEGDQGFVSSIRRNHFHGADFVWNQLLGDYFSLVPEYHLTRSEELFGVRHENDATLRLFYISPRRFWVSAGENYIHQRGNLNSKQVRSNFFTTDLNFAYEFPRKLGLISLAMVNVFDHPFVVLVDPFALDPRVPRRQVTLNLRFNL